MLAMTPLMLSGLGFASVVVIFIGFAISARPSQAQARLTVYAARQPRTLEELELQRPFFDRVVKPVIGAFARIVLRYTPQSTIDGIRHRLTLAGNPRGLLANDFLGLQGFLALILGGGGFLLLYLGKNPLPKTVILTAVFTALGFYLPNIWLSRQISQRQDAIVKALPDALDLLTISVEAGLGFDAAMAKVVEKWTNPLTMEFARVIGEIRMGKARREALREMAQRCEVPDVTTFIAAIIQADQLGVSIARVLRIQSEQMRVRRRQRAEQKAHEAPVKMVFPLVLLIFPSLFVVILGPAIPKILRSLGGLGK
ncbi:MAG: type II secretion system F family protein [Chloroflexi bacterium]|nr:type II secretion system F family protein [Chloroflexota bacterium]